MIVLTQSYYVHSASFFQCILLYMLLEPYLYTRTKSNFLTVKYVTFLSYRKFVMDLDSKYDEL
jgi:hypothetical protein